MLTNLGSCFHSVFVIKKTLRVFLLEGLLGDVLFPTEDQE